MINIIPLINACKHKSLSDLCVSIYAWYCILHFAFSTLHKRSPYMKKKTKIILHIKTKLSGPYTHTQYSVFHIIKWIFIVNIVIDTLRRVPIFSPLHIYATHYSNYTKFYSTVYWIPVRYIWMNMFHFDL